jgi:hypothetical protein
MKTLEIIHLRLAGNNPQNLVDIIREAIGPHGDELDICIYQHTKLTNDLSVHLKRESTGRDEDASDVGTRLAALLKDFGMVAHSVWTECCDLDEEPAHEGD